MILKMMIKNHYRRRPHRVEEESFSPSSSVVLFSVVPFETLLVLMSTLAMPRKIVK